MSPISPSLESCWKNNFFNFSSSLCEGAFPFVLVLTGGSCFTPLFTICRRQPQHRTPWPCGTTRLSSSASAAEPPRPLLMLSSCASKPPIWSSYLVVCFCECVQLKPPHHGPVGLPLWWRWEQPGADET